MLQEVGSLNLTFHLGSQVLLRLLLSSTVENIFISP
jgi:hypothetical protein